MSIFDVVIAAAAVISLFSFFERGASFEMCPIVDKIKGIIQLVNVLNPFSPSKKRKSEKKKR